MRYDGNDTRIMTCLQGLAKSKLAAKMESKWPLTDA